jgi:hypothetical protein
MPTLAFLIHNTTGALLTQLPAQALPPGSIAPQAIPNNTFAIVVFQMATPPANAPLPATANLGYSAAANTWRIIAAVPQDGRPPGPNATATFNGAAGNRAQIAPGPAIPNVLAAFYFNVSFS